MRSLWRIALGVTCVLRIVTACVDTSPLHYDAPSADAGADAAPVDAAVLNACRECVTGDDAPCRAMYDPCRADPRCTIFSDCLFDLGCFSLAQLQDRIACGGPCFTKANVAASSDPALVLALPINGCTSPGNVCAHACVGQ